MIQHLGGRRADNRLEIPASCLAGRVCIKGPFNYRRVKFMLMVATVMGVLTASSVRG